MNSPLLTTLFLKDIPEHMSTSDQLYTGYLINQLKEREEMILDFSCLQSSIDPADASGFISSEQDSNEKFDYEQFLVCYFNSTEVLPSLKTLKVRELARASPKISLIDGINQMHALRELDLSGNDLSKDDIHDNLQFWGLLELRTLKLDNTHLKSLHPSIGRLQYLEHLSLSNNLLATLPATVEYCQNLRYLNLTKNKFIRFPSAVLRLKNLQDFKRLDNHNLDKRFNGYERWPHMTTSSRPSTSQNSENQTKKSPSSLQALSSCAVLTNRTDYWNGNDLPPRQCKLLDDFATHNNFCEKCYQSHAKMCELKVMVLKFVGLNDVPFTIPSCEDCLESLKETYKVEQEKLKQKIEEDYQREMVEAMENLRSEGITFPDTLNRSSSNTRRRRRGGKKCSIM